MTPKHLTAEQRAELAKAWLQQAEGRALEAWVNSHLNPNDAALRAHYGQLEGQLRWLEGEVEKWG